MFLIYDHFSETRDRVMKLLRACKQDDQFSPSQHKCIVNAIEKLTVSRRGPKKKSIDVKPIAYILGKSLEGFYLLLPFI